ncbi:MAG: DUF4920 domain-containing protein [Ignavibacteriales bacterium]|nr:DUF4920 domain-containing protein [Ignavibacteriales bacterium]
MKQLSIIILSFLITTSLLFAQEQVVPNAKAQPREKYALTWDAYGEKISTEKSKPLADILKQNQPYDTNDVLLEGTIAEVCENKGCWMVLENEKTTVRVEFKNYGFFVPWDAQGKKVKVQGQLKEKKVSASTAKHMAGEMKNSPIKKEEIKKENIVTVFVANGVEIEKGGTISEEQQAIIDGKKKKEGHDEEHGDDHDH